MKQYFGKYIGSIESRWLKEREMKLLVDFKFEDPDNILWVAPKGSIVDGASIPRLLWTLVGAPFSGAYRDASVIHDVACQEKSRRWQDVHLCFYNAMRTSDVSTIKAKTMYAGVYYFGPKWETPASKSFDYFEDSNIELIGNDISLDLDDTREESKFKESDFARLKNLIEENDEISLEEIRAFR